MKTLIVTGGALDHSFASAYLDEQAFDYMIAADYGIHFFAQTGRMPDEAVGDFDSAEEEELLLFRSSTQTAFHQFQPEKDETDTELALRLALERGSSEVHILGGMGSRIDHTLGTIHLLGIALEQGVLCYLLDADNRLRLITSRTVLQREKQYGNYVSLIPMTPKAEGVTLTGFKYPLRNYCMDMFHPLGISNEIVEEEAVVDLRSGILILVEAKELLKVISQQFLKNRK